MGHDAEQNGFVIDKSGRAGISKRNLAVFKKKIDDIYSQVFEIEYDSFSSKLSLLSIGATETRCCNIDDDLEFRRVIADFATIMRECKYPEFEKVATQPRFDLSDHGFLLKNYRQLSIEYCNKNNITVDGDFIDKLYYIDSKVKDLRENHFEDIKDELMHIASFYITVLLKYDCTSIEDYKGYDTFAIVSGKNGVSYVLKDLLRLWTEGETDIFIKKSCKLVMSREEITQCLQKLT